MKKKLFLLTCIVAVLACIRLPAMAFEVGVRGYYWLPALNGDIKVEGNGIPGTTLDLENDLGLDDEYYPVIEFFAGTGRHHVSLSYYKAEYDGSNVLDRSITFHGKTFTASDLIETSLKYSVYDILYQYDLLDLENILAGFSLGLAGKVKVINGSVEVKSSALSASDDFTAPIPLVGLNLHVGILADILEARLLSMGIAYGNGTMFDVQADFAVTPFPFLDIHGGYRVFLIDIDADDVKFNYNTSGPYLAVTFSF